MSAQDIINPYLNWEGVQLTNFGIPTINLERSGSAYYSGEYEISLESMPFGNETVLEVSPSQIGGYILKLLGFWIN